MLASGEQVPPPVMQMCEEQGSDNNSSIQGLQASGQMCAM